ncbi:MAG: DUF481 domain-containing protein [Melioribacteraceae bacterium]|nr:DUF481 domain-containing protein [Melioribacteraceae bacterium]
MKNISNKIFVLLLILAASISAQTDTLITTNGEIISGEIKNMDRGVITIETEYSDSDFKIEWDKIFAIHSKNNFIVSLSNGERLVGKLYGTNDALYIKTTDNIVAIESLDDTFLGRLSASIGIGVNLTKSNKLRQFNMRSSLGYFAQNWKADASFDAVYSEQTDADQTKRIDGKMSYIYFLLKDWFISASSDFLQNDEQKLKLRSTPKIGFGNYIIHNNSVYLSIGGGVSGNFENYTDPTLKGRNSSEIFLSAELNMFDFGDLSLLTSTVAYKNLNEGDRLRNDFKVDLKYDLLGSDFYIKIGYTLNYDSNPIKSAETTDYVIQTTFGWSL